MASPRGQPHLMPRQAIPPTAAPQDAVGPIGLADALGWASAALGAPMLLNRHAFLKTIGVRDERRTRLLSAAVGVREFLATATILPMRHRRVGVYSRVAGDVMDLSLLASAWTSKREDPVRLLGATAFVAAVLGADAYVAFRLSAAEGTYVDDASASQGIGAPPDVGGGPTRVRTAVTVRGSEEQVRQAVSQFEWRAFDPAKLEAAGELRYASAPGDRGTEIHLDHDPGAPGGAIGASALKLAGRSPDQKINDDLRRFKALFETGVEVRSDKTPQPFSARRQILQRPAQPVGGPA